MNKAEFIFDGVPDGKGNLMDYTVVLCGNSGRFSASVSASEKVLHYYSFAGIKVDFSAEMAERIMRLYLSDANRMEG